MARKGRTGNGRSRFSFDRDPKVLIGRCEPCDKFIYLSRKTAKVAARKTPSTQGGGVRPYPCPVSAGHWHVGHVPGAVRRGDITRDDWDRLRGVRRWAS